METEERDCSINNMASNDVFATFEPIMSNRFIVKFPKELQLKHYCVQKVLQPKFVDGEWSNLEIYLYNPIGGGFTMQAIHEFIKIWTMGIGYGQQTFTIELIRLDPVGVDVQITRVKFDRVVEIDFGDMNYEIDDINIIKMIFKTKFVELEY